MSRSLIGMAFFVLILTYETIIYIILIVTIKTSEVFKMKERTKTEIEQSEKLLKKQLAILEKEQNKLIERFTTQEFNYKKEIERLNQVIQDLEDKLSRKGKGKPRNNNTTDTDVTTLRNEGKTIRDICSTTRLSSATVTKILSGKK